MCLDPLDGVVGRSSRKGRGDARIGVECYGLGTCWGVWVRRLDCLGGALCGNVLVGLLRRFSIGAPWGGIISFLALIVVSSGMDSPQTSPGPTLLQKGDGLVVVDLLGHHGEFH